MYEKFSGRARKVMALATQEAQRFSREFIGTEHILLGLAKEGNGVGTTVLKNLGVDLKKLRESTEKHTKSGPDMVTMGRLPQTPGAKKVIEFAIEEARELGHNYVGTEHLLLGLVHPNGDTGLLAFQILVREFGLSYEKVREGVVAILEADTPELVHHELSNAVTVRPAKSLKCEVLTFQNLTKERIGEILAAGRIVDRFSRQDALVIIYEPYD